MRSIRLWAIGTVVIVIAVLALGWVVGIQPLLAQAATAASNADQVDEINAQEQATLMQLKEEYESIDDIRAEVEEAQLSVPTTAGLSAFILQLNSLAAATGVTVSDITTGTGVLYVLPEEATILDENGEPVAAPAAPANLVYVPLDLKISGPYDAVLSFVKGLQSGERLFMITQLALAAEDAPAPDPKVKAAPVVVTFGGDITGQIYVLVDPDAPVDAIEEPAPEASPAPSPSASPTP